jgi:hypothetical protein
VRGHRGAILDAGSVLKDASSSGTVPRMASRPEITGFPARAQVRGRARTRATRLRRLGLAAVCLAIAIPVIVLAFDYASPASPVSVPPADRLLQAPPTLRVVALQGDLRLYLPIQEGRVTAVGYHAVGDGALTLDPVGTQANAGVFTRLLRRLFGEDKGSIRFYLMGGSGGSETEGLDIGAPPGTDVYAPVNGTVIGISPRKVAGEQHGVRIDIQPSGSPGLVVSLQNLEPDPALSVGSTVAAARTKIGGLIDLSEVERPALAEFTQDRGTHVHMEVRAAVSLPLP